MGRGRQRERSLVPENAGLMLMAGPREEARAGTRRGTGAREGGGANTGVDEGEGGGWGGAGAGAWAGTIEMARVNTGGGKVGNVVHEIMLLICYPDIAIFLQKHYCPEPVLSRM